jgi:hypothetical protein
MPSLKQCPAASYNAEKSHKIKAVPITVGSDKRTQEPTERAPNGQAGII